VEAVDDDGPDSDPDLTSDELETLTEVLDSHVAFTGHISKLAFAQRTAALEVTFQIPAESPITNRDLLHLRHRISTIVITPVTRSTMPGATAGSALKDPVTSRVTEARLQRAMDSWLVDGRYDPTDEPAMDDEEQ
jgi:hypothetical protein